MPGIPSFIRNHGVRRVRVWTVVATIFVTLASATAAQALDPQLDPRAASVSRWLAQDSLVEIALPLAFRARIDGNYLRTRDLGGRLRFGDITRVSTGLVRRGPHLLESRVSVASPSWKGLEVEFAWASRSLLSMRGAVDFDRQIVGAFIRFTP